MVELYESQKAVLAEIEGKPNAGLYLGCGAGKTFVGSEKMMSYGTKWNLLICQKSKVDDWVNHFKTHYPKVTVTDFTKRGNLTLGNLRPGVMIINYDLVFRRPILSSLKDFTLMLDESSLIQNDMAKRTKFILKLKPAHTVLLSGTPVSGGQIDKERGLIFGKFENLYSQVRLLGWRISKKEFWTRYVNWEMRQYGEIRVKEVVGYKHVPELNAKLKEIGCVFRRTEDMVDLPDYDDQTIYVDNIPEYRKMDKNGIVVIDDEEMVGDLPITKLMRLRQLCGDYNHTKVSAFSDLMDSLENERVVVFYNFKRDLEAIKQVVGDTRPFFQINGDMKDWDEDTWILPENQNAVVACQYNSGSHGHNMQASRYIVYFDVTNRAEYFDQSRGRIRRDGQKAERVMYYHLVVKGSVEESILANVRRGVDYTVDDYINEYEGNE